MEVVSEPAGYDALTYRDWTVPQGSDTTNPFRFGEKESQSATTTWADLTQAGYYAECQMRNRVGEDEWVTFKSTDLTGPRISLTAEGYIYVTLPHDETEKPEWNERTKGVYDVELTTPEGVKWRIGKGIVTVEPDVTRVSNA